MKPLILGCLALLLPCFCLANETADIVVYGDAAGGVAAAVQGAREGKSVVLVSQYGHLGGLSSSGLGFSDIGHPAILGGIAKEFYGYAYEHYQKPGSWTQQKRSEFSNRGQGLKAIDDERQIAISFEPKVAEGIFDEMVAKAGVKLIKGRLDLKNGTVMEGRRITAIRLEDGRLMEGKMFVDASYEGDLLDEAGVRFIVGREPNARFEELGNGITGPRRGNQLIKGIDPYIEPGKPASGLLPFVNPDMGGTKGEGDHRFQAYCYRTVMTDVAENRVPVEKPKAYKERDYEILFRAIEAGAKGPGGRFFKVSPIPNAKTDSNNTGGISMDYIGGNYGDGWNWTTLSHAEREAVAAKHRDWQLGLIWTLQHHPRVPESIRKMHAPWGLAKDEFVDNNHWPYNLYVREGRRMHSDFVMTERHCRNQAPVEDPVGMGAYTLDSHNTQRFVENGMVRNEGDIQSPIKKTGPYGISYRSIMPRVGDCENLLAPIALSSTHIAFGSIRMEPVFMILGQSAGSAASLAIDRGIAVQDVPYPALREKLEKDGQILRYNDAPKRTD